MSYLYSTSKMGFLSSGGNIRPRRRDNGVFNHLYEALSANDVGSALESCPDNIERPPDEELVCNAGWSVPSSTVRERV